MKFKKKNTSDDFRAIWPPDLPRRVGRFRFRRHKKRYFEGDGGQLHYKKLRVYGSTPAEVVEKARRKQRLIDEHGQHAVGLTTGERWQMVSCLEICRPLGLTPYEACQQIAAQHPKGGNVRTLAEVVAELIRKKRRSNRREHYVDALERALNGFAKLFDGRAINTITTIELDAEIERHPKWAPATVHGTVSTWKVLFNFAKLRGYCTANPADKIELPEKDSPEPEIFTVEQVRAMFAHTLFADRDPLLPACRAYLAIGIFAGVRPEEIARLDWEQVDLRTATITVLGAKAKCRARRIVDMSPNLVAWLRPIARKTGKVLRHDIRLLRAAIRRAMKLERWPHDVLRHSFGSYHFGHHRNEALVKNQMGHSDDGRMFFSHYRQLVAREEAALFWAIYPPCGLLARQ